MPLSRPRTFLARLSGTAERGFALADEHGFLHLRVRMYTKILLVFFVLFTLGGVIKYFSLHGEKFAEVKQDMVPGVWGFVAVTVLLALFALVVRRSECKEQSLHVVESVGVVCACTAVGTLNLFLPLGLPQVASFLLMILILFVRAAIVPSTVRRTVLVGLLSTVGVTFFLGARAVHAPVREDVLIDYDRYVWGIALGWGIIFTVVTAIVSRVIYGLQKTARDAMRLGNYTLDEKLGEGGMGVVYLARHALLQRPTALKLLPREKAGEAAIVRFEREVQQTSRLAHPNTVEIYDFGRTPDGIFYYVMEYLDGLTLRELVDMEGTQPPGRVIYILAQVAHALADAHAADLVHRDIKPANVILCDRGGVADMAKVVDFGLVKDVTAPAEIAVSAANSITGTPLYLAPECLTNPERVDGRSDLYSLGAVGYFMLTGENVFGGDSVVEVCGHHLHTEPERPSERRGSEVGEDLDKVILRCLAKKPIDRYSDAASLRAALLACEGAGSWGLDEATAWWDQHGKRVRAFRRGKRERVAEGPANTLAVSLQGRAEPGG